MSLFSLIFYSYCRQLFELVCKKSYITDITSFRNITDTTYWETSTTYLRNITDTTYLRNITDITFFRNITDTTSLRNIADIVSLIDAFSFYFCNHQIITIIIPSSLTNLVRVCRLIFLTVLFSHQNHLELFFDLLAQWLAFIFLPLFDHRLFHFNY
jgi:hypothetical protein